MLRQQQRGRSGWSRVNKGRVDLSVRGGGGPDGVELVFASPSTYQVGTLGWCGWGTERVGTLDPSLAAAVC